jgi:hypothetical protein
MERVLEAHKPQIALLQALNNTNVTSRWFNARTYRSAVVIATALAMAASTTFKAELLQATDDSGTGSKAITGAEKTITANTLVTRMTITLATFLATGTITINGLVFTAHATTTTVANREFSIAGTDTADAAALVTCINDATYGVPGVTASNAAGVVTLIASDGYAITVASTPDDATVVKATVEAGVLIDVNTESLDTANGFGFVAVKLTTTANTTASVAILSLGDGYHRPVDQILPETIL